jgi:hypothetical protein
MFRTLIVILAAAPSVALACPGKEAQMATTVEAPKVQLAATAAVDPTHCAKSAALVGSNCAWSTGAMAQRVQAEGKDTTVTAKLATQPKQLQSHVAAPFQVGDMYVIANQVIETADPAATLAMNGKVLEVDGVKYFLVTTFQKANT